MYEVSKTHDGVITSSYMKLANHPIMGYFIY